MNFKLYYKDYGHREMHQGPGGDYDYDWYEYHDYQYDCVTVTGEKGYYDVALFPGEIEPGYGDNVYVVYVSYNTGDSFGHEENARVHLWAFSDEDRAWRFSCAIKNDAEQNPNYDFKNKPFKFEGVPVNTNEWKGYFENFNECNYVTLTLKRKQ